MKFGFDLDSTLDHPEIVRIANALYDLGDEVHVITVGRLKSAGYLTTQAEKYAKLDRLGVKYTHCVLVGGDTFEEAGRRKAEYIREHGIGLMIDDSSTFVKEIALGSGALVLHVKTRDTYSR